MRIVLEADQRSDHVDQVVQAVGRVGGHDADERGDGVGPDGASVRQIGDEVAADAGRGAVVAGPLLQCEQGRPDDNPESFKVRLEAYNRNTAPLLPYYEAQGKLTEADGMGSIESVAKAIDEALA